MANENSILCPLCGNKVPPGLTRCPVCATELQRVITKRTEESPAVSSDFLKKDIPSAQLPQTQSNCPQCGLGLHGGEAKCPRCGIPLSAEEALLECPDCGALSPKDSKTCTRCGCNLREKRAPTPKAPPRPAPAPRPAPPPPVPVAKPEVVEKVEVSARQEPPIVSEKVTPPPVPPVRMETAKPREEVTPQSPVRSAPTGFVNGRGAINGTGLVNGRGAINGTGITNGTRAESRPPSSASRPRRAVTRWQYLALLVALIVVIPTFMFLSYSQNPAPISIDGTFDDWSEVTAFGMHHNSATDRTNVTAWAVETHGANLYVYVSTLGSMMSTTAIDSFLLFVDSDGSATSGYVVSDIGAEYKLEFDGWNGSIESASTSRYLATDDRTDWSRWEDFGTPTARLASTQFEGVASLTSLGENARYVLISQTGDSDRGISYPVQADTPVLIVHQETGSGFASGVVPSSDSVTALRLTLSCQGGSGSVTVITPSVSGATPIPVQTGEISLSPATPATVDVSVDTSGWAPGSVVSVSIVSEDVTSEFDSVVVTGVPARAYISAAPASIEIDGAFADWIGLTTADSDLVEMEDPNVDISAVGAVNTSASSSFYASVVGEMCMGSFVPSHITKPSGAGGGSVIPAKKTGEDILRVYLDTDMNASTGSVVIHPSETIGADFQIEIRGLNGEITDKAIMEYASGAWNYVSGTILAAKDGQQMELSVPSSDIEYATAIKFIIEMTNWKGWSDTATCIPQGTRSADMPGTRAWIVDTTVASAAATATSNQRKLFHDGTNFWSIYVDGQDTVARYSSNGMTWTNDGRIFKTNGVGRASLWYDRANQTVYVVGDRTAATVNVYLQKGTVSPATQTISWSAADRVLAVSTYTMASKNTYISRDASGYVWLMTANCSGTTPTRYDLSVFRNAALNSVAGAWTAVGSVVSTSQQSSLKGCILPAGTGSDMWAVYVYMGTVASRKYSGTWGAETVLYTPTAGAGNTDLAPPSALVDSRGVLHVVYGSDHEQPIGTAKPHIYYLYNAGSAWSSALALSSTANNIGFLYPTISLDASTGNLYVFWCSMQTQYVEARRNVSGTWSTLTLNVQTADAKAYLTSIYSAPSPNHICYLWTQNATAPIHVIFDRIPEFSDAVLPVLGAFAVVVLVSRRARDRKQSD